MPYPQYFVEPIRRTGEFVVECAPCPVCGAGELNYRGFQIALEGELRFIHACGNCGANAGLTVAFPRIAPDQPNNPYNL